jgi:hypothetical protein
MRRTVTTSDESATPAPCPRWVVGPLGEALFLEDLPPPDAKWTPLRKAMVVAAVKGSLISINDALARYNLSVEEFAGWQRALERHGMAALQMKRAQHYRGLQERSQRFGWAA